MFNINEYLRSMLEKSNEEEHIEAETFKNEMHLIDERYKAENKLLDAIAIGNEQSAMEAIMNYGKLMQSPQQKASPTSDDSLRDFKNSVQTMNTLFRKAIENNKVHPIYIHESSSRFGDLIEHASSFEELVSLISDMIKRYCHLSRHYSLASYSKTVHDAILYIDLNLCSPISTRNISESLFLSPNYISSQFNQETGKTITDYIRERRIKMAKRLLLSTYMTIQEIATTVGIDDISYFSKQFKLETGLSPHQYRKENRRPNE